MIGIVEEEDVMVLPYPLTATAESTAVLALVQSRFADGGADWRTNVGATDSWGCSGWGGTTAAEAFFTTEACAVSSTGLIDGTVRTDGGGGGGGGKENFKPCDPVAGPELWLPAAC
jgi:hypothetical protein